MLKEGLVLLTWCPSFAAGFGNGTCAGKSRRRRPRTTTSDGRSTRSRRGPTYPPTRPRAPPRRGMWRSAGRRGGPSSSFSVRGGSGRSSGGEGGSTEGRKEGRGGRVQRGSGQAVCIDAERSSTWTIFRSLWYCNRSKIMILDRFLGDL